MSEKKTPSKLISSEIKKAPDTLIQENIDQLDYIFDGPKNLRESELPTALKILSTEGHMTQGHKLANGTKYPDTSQLDILRAHYKSPFGEQRPYKERYLRNIIAEEIINTHKFYEETLDILFNKKRVSSSQLYDPTTNRLKIANPKNGEFLFPFTLVQQTRLPLEKRKLLEVIKAGIKGFEMDSQEHRIATVERFPVNLNGDQLEIGTGKCHVGNLEHIRKRKISLEKLASEQISPEEIEWLYKNHCLVSVKDFSNYQKHNNYLFPVFIRGNKGLGCCDDLTTLGIGFQLHHLGEKTISAGYTMARVSDYIDTFDKISGAPITGGADEYISKEIRNKYRKLARKENLEIAQDYFKSRLKKRFSLNEIEESVGEEISKNTLQNFIHKKTGAVFDLSSLEEHLFPDEIVTQEEMTKTIFFGAKNNYPSLPMSDSVRRFEELQYSHKENGTHYSISSAHLKFLLTGKPTEGLKFGFEKLASEDFYEIATSRLTDFVDSNIFPKPIFWK